MLPVIALPPGAKQLVADSVRLPKVLVNLVADYAAELDFSLLLTVDLHFDAMCRVTNPGIRALFKEAFMSSYCSPQLKTTLIRREYLEFMPAWPLRDYRIRQELELIFEEIVDGGGCIILDHIDLSGLEFLNLNWEGASLRFTNLTQARLIEVNLRGADLTGAAIAGGVWLEVDLVNAKLSGIDRSKLGRCDDVNLTGATGLVTDGTEESGGH